jgi:hypothetical protein
MRHARGAFAVLGEAITPHWGFSPSDPDRACYLAMAEAPDIPLGIQIGPAPPGNRTFFRLRNMPTNMATRWCWLKRWLAAI